MRYLRQPSFDIDDGADEMHRDSVVAPRVHDIVPQLTAFFLTPTVGALVDWDNELR